MTKVVTMTQDNNISTAPVQSESLHDAVKKAVSDYFQSNDASQNNLYERILGEVEAPLFTFLLEQANNNQCEITRWLGLARGTVRKKMKQYGLLNKRKVRANLA